MFRFQAQGEAPTSGTRVLSQGEHAGEVVMATSTLLGCELLAVVSVAQSTAPLTLENGGTPLELMTLPYELPASA
jgi:hypothetical protein